MVLNWTCSKEEALKVHDIVKRAKAMAKDLDMTVDGISLDMDIMACHCNGCPLDLEKLLAADNFNFVHDAFGIQNHIDRETWQLKDRFVPRCAKRE